MRFDTSHTLSDLPDFFPIASQSTPDDKLFLLGAMRLARNAGRYSYMEIGSFLGGSLAPFLMDSLCEAVLSIDDRGRIQPDERGISYDYSRFTTQSMLNELARCHIPTEKLTTFDGSIDALTDGSRASFDIAFIDGEHTDEACFRDFLWTIPLVKSDSMVIFHDSTLIYKALKLIAVYLNKQQIPYLFFKKANSEMSALLFGAYRNSDPAQYFGPGETAPAFFSRSEAFILDRQFRNRIRFRFAPRKLLKRQLPIRAEVEMPSIEKI
jgi:hypothetical protein